MTTSAATLASRLESIVGNAHVLTQPADCASYSVNEISPSIVARPANAQESAAIVRFTVAEKLSLIPCGARTKLEIGMPPSRFDIALDMTRLNQIAHYDAGDLTLSADAGMPLAQVNAVLSERNQFLPLLVPYYSVATIGGVIASGLDSPLRQFYGTARDFLIGAEFIDGTGSLCKSGGRVVKNVTGYDLHKLLVASLGTLVVITRLNFRTFPLPIFSRGFVASFPTMERALALRKKIAESPLNVLTLDVIDPSLARIFSERYPSTPEVPVFRAENPATTAAHLPLPGDWFRRDEWQVCTAFAGTPEVLDRCSRDLYQLAATANATSATVLDDATRPSLWGRLRESLSMLRDASPNSVVFKFSADTAQHAALLAHLQQITGAASLPCASISRAVGAVYFALFPDPADAQASARSHQAAAQIFDHAASLSIPATILFAPTALKRHVNIWGSPRPDLPLMHRIKSAFDPQSLFAPARFL